ncbi:MAG: serine/threonine protein kinase [Deltaproteobacteria bacterium]|nr:serine/threonine protein kinase [Deltaproteobacteria bacterium]
MSDGVVYGNYFLLGRLAQGGMAEVFLGKRLDATEADPLLAIKRLLPRLSGDPDFVAMFGDEARIARGLTHPHICKLYDQGEHAGQLFLVMEFIHGKELKVVQRRAQTRGEPIPHRLVAHIGRRIAEALDYAHRKNNSQGVSENIVHRDISPQNILISYDGTPKLIDFGIARARDRLVKTRVGVVKGKTAYMSPEQATGQPLDARADIFSLGVTLYELLTGALPFKGQSDLSVLQKIARADYPPPQQVNADIPRRLAATIERAMARDRNHRYSSAAELAADLDRYLADENKEVSPEVLSAHMRKLFRDDYIREMARIKTYLAIRPSTSVSRADAPPAAEGVTEAQGAGIEKTYVSPSQFLAAGYDPGAELDVQIETDDAGLEGGETFGEDIQLATVGESEPVTSPAIANPNPLSAAAPASASVWDDGMVTDRFRQVPNGAAMMRAALKLESQRAASRADDSEPTGPQSTIGGATPLIAPDPPLPPEPETPLGQRLEDYDDYKPQAQVAGSDDWAADGRTEISLRVEMSDPEVEEFAKVFREGAGEHPPPSSPPPPQTAMPDLDTGPQVAVNEITSPPAPQPGAFAVIEDSGVLDVRGIKDEVAQALHRSAGSAPVDEDDGTRQLGRREIAKLVEVAENFAGGATSMVPPPAPPPPEDEIVPGVSAKEFDDELSRELRVDLGSHQAAQAEITKPPVERPRMTPPKAAPPVAKSYEDSDRTPISTPRTDRRRLLTDMEIAILIFAAALGMVLVVGAYWYASTMPIDRPAGLTPSQSTSQAESPPPIR